jgi:katanin p60 ATPase-containing subunit A1
MISPFSILGDEHEASRRVKTEIFAQMDGIVSDTPNTTPLPIVSDTAKPEAGKVMVLAATNCPWDLDEAIRRRLEKRILIGEEGNLLLCLSHSLPFCSPLCCFVCVGCFQCTTISSSAESFGSYACVALADLPDLLARAELFHLCLSELELEDGVELSKLARATENYSGSDIKQVCREASMAPMRRMVANKTSAEIQELVRLHGNLVGGFIGADDLWSAIESTRPSTAIGDMRYAEWEGLFGSA